MKDSFWSASSAYDLFAMRSGEKKKYAFLHFFKEENSALYKGEVDCNYISPLRNNTLYLPKILKRIGEGAPKGTDIKSRRYLGKDVLR